MTWDQFYNHAGPFSHFKSHEWLTKGASHSQRTSRAFGLNTDPPPELWQNSIPLLKTVDHLRAICGSRIVITSAYRSPAYNRAIGGANESWHTKFLAADLIPLDITPRKLHWFAREFRAAQNFRGGLGLYRSFVHIDVRGRNADW
jgi:uncharacterized protein YcbK (DUF882 family)